MTSFKKNNNNERIPKGSKMISFDVKSLLTNMPLHQTIELILSKIYQEKKIKISIPKNILRDLLYLCAKEVQFKFTMGSLLGQLPANIFMASLEAKVIAKLAPYLCKWKRYVDDTHAYINPGKVDFILTKLKSNHPRTVTNQIETCAHRKETSTDLYINWNSHAPVEWKIGTLRNLVKRAKTVCSTTITPRNRTPKSSIYWNK